MVGILKAKKYVHTCLIFLSHKGLFYTWHTEKRFVEIIQFNHAQWFHVFFNRTFLAIEMLC